MEVLFSLDLDVRPTEEVAVWHQAIERDLPKFRIIFDSKAKNNFVLNFCTFTIALMSDPLVITLQDLEGKTYYIVSI